MANNKSPIALGPFKLEYVTQSNGNLIYNVLLGGREFAKAEIDDDVAPDEILDIAKESYRKFRSICEEQLKERLMDSKYFIFEIPDLAAIVKSKSMGVHGTGMGAAFGAFLEQRPKLEPNKRYVQILRDVVGGETIYQEDGVTAGQSLYERPLPNYAWMLFLLPTNAFSASADEWDKPTVDELRLFLGEYSFVNAPYSLFCYAAGISPEVNTPEAVHEQLTHKGWLRAADEFGFGLVPLQESVDA